MSWIGRGRVHPRRKRCFLLISQVLRFRQRSACSHSLVARSTMWSEKTCLWLSHFFPWSATFSSLVCRYSWLLHTAFISLACCYDFCFAWHFSLAVRWSWLFGRKGHAVECVMIQWSAIRRAQCAFSVANPLRCRMCYCRSVVPAPAWKRTTLAYMLPDVAVSSHQLCWAWSHV